MARLVDTGLQLDGVEGCLDLAILRLEVVYFELQNLLDDQLDHQQLLPLDQIGIVEVTRSYGLDLRRDLVPLLLLFVRILLLPHQVLVSLHVSPPLVIALHVGLLDLLGGDGAQCPE